MVFNILNFFLSTYNQNLNSVTIKHKLHKSSYRRLYKLIMFFYTNGLIFNLKFSPFLMINLAPCYLMKKFIFLLFFKKSKRFYFNVKGIKLLNTFQSNSISFFKTTKGYITSKKLNNINEGGILMFTLV